MENEIIEEEVVVEEVEEEKNPGKKSGKIETLFFKESFYCKELKRPFKGGYYTPDNDAEFKAIEKFGTPINQEKKKMGVR